MRLMMAVPSTAVVADIRHIMIMIMMIKSYPAFVSQGINKLFGLAHY